MAANFKNGMTIKQLEQLKKLKVQGKIPKSLRIKWGVPLIPAFPITLVVSMYVGDLFLVVLKLIN